MRTLLDDCEQSLCVVLVFFPFFLFLFCLVLLLLFGISWLQRSTSLLPFYSFNLPLKRSHHTPLILIRVRLRGGVGCGLIKPTWAEYGPSAQQPPPSAHKGGCPMTPQCEAIPTNCRHISCLSFGKVFVNMSAPLSSV